MLDKFFLFLAVCMVITGTINTLTAKYADDTHAKGIDGKTTQFNHPYFQTACMFVGEFFCLLAFKAMMFYNERKEITVERVPFNPVIFLLPACCDMTATSLMNVGLTMTYASVFQMLRGSVIIYTGILSVLFLKRKLRLYHWAGMISVLIGLAFVGLASIFSGSSSNASDPIVGDIIIVCAQIIVAVQMVIEEKFIGKFNVPALQVVGWEGIWGLSVLSCILVLFYYIPGSSAGNHFENAPDAFVMMSNSTPLTLFLLGNVFSIAFFNYFGVSITKYASATTRMVIDSIRTLVIWGWSLAFGLQEFQYFQLIGFAFLILGTCIYNEVLVIPFLGRPQPKEVHDEVKPLLEDNDKVRD